ncbi:MAG TPA: hypothetical protein VJG48_02140 [Candidatus Paceibacterota bacterium]
MSSGRFQINPRYFWTLSTLIVAGLIAYVFLVQGSIYYGLSANALSSLLQTEESKLALLESSYYQVSTGVDINLARELGFIESEHTLFVPLDSSGDLVGYANKGAR